MSIPYRKSPYDTRKSVRFSLNNNQERYMNNRSRKEYKRRQQENSLWFLTKDEENEGRSARDSKLERKNPDYFTERDNRHFHHTNKRITESVQDILEKHGFIVKKKCKYTIQTKDKSVNITTKELNHSLLTELGIVPDAEYLADGVWEEWTKQKGGTRRTRKGRKTRKCGRGKK
jgi:hypothetical protein